MKRNLQILLMVLDVIGLMGVVATEFRCRPGQAGTLADSPRCEEGLAFTCERSDEKTLVVANTAWSWRVQQGRKFFEVSDQTRDKAVRLRAKAAGNSLLDPAFQDDFNFISLMCSISSRTGGDVLCLLAEPLENVNLPDHSACFLLEDGVAPASPRELDWVGFDPYGTGSMDKPLPTILPDAVTVNATRLSRDAHKIIAGTIAAVTGCAILLYLHKLSKRHIVAPTRFQKLLRVICLSSYCSSEGQPSGHTRDPHEDTNSKATSVYSEECVDPTAIDALNAVVDGALPQVGVIGARNTVTAAADLSAAAQAVRPHRRIKKNQRKLRCKRHQNARCTLKSGSSPTNAVTMATEGCDLALEKKCQKILRRRRHTDGSTGTDACSGRGLSFLGDSASTPKDRCPSRLANIGFASEGADENPCAVEGQDERNPEAVGEPQAAHRTSRPTIAATSPEDGFPAISGRKLLDFETVAQVITDGKLDANAAINVEAFVQVFKSSPRSVSDDEADSDSDHSVNGHHRPRQNQQSRYRSRSQHASSPRRFVNLFAATGGNPTIPAILLPSDPVSYPNQQRRQYYL